MLQNLDNLVEDVGVLGAELAKEALSAAKNGLLVTLRVKDDLEIVSITFPPMIENWE